MLGIDLVAATECLTESLMDNYIAINNLVDLIRVGSVGSVGSAQRQTHHAITDCVHSSGIKAKNNFH